MLVLRDDCDAGDTGDADDDDSVSTKLSFFVDQLKVFTEFSLQKNA